MSITVNGLLLLTQLARTCGVFLVLFTLYLLIRMLAFNGQVIKRLLWQVASALFFVLWFWVGALAVDLSALSREYAFIPWFVFDIGLLQFVMFLLGPVRNNERHDDGINRDSP